MTSARWAQIRQIFEDALERAPGNPSAYVAEVCSGDEELRREVESLLARRTSTGGILAMPLAALPSFLAEGEIGTAANAEPEQPRMVGPYRLLQTLGEGGMGEVWLAEQTRPIRRRVALKIIKAGMDTKQVVARFESERQALAMMDHPAIAKVFEAGSTAEGRPYFAMEYVPGVAITAHCDTHRVPTQERLRLLVDVCEGVQHAHQKAIIHRDLKPSNVLISIRDGNAAPKIIDFGVAKATAQPLTETTMFTQLGAMIGTPEYMSPEQAGLTAQDVDTRTDVYSLGVILYELLVGALPFDSRELRQAGYEGVRKKILDEEPLRPSTKLCTLGDGSALAARNRGTDTTALAHRLKGDLDWITMKAIEKDRTRRYGSPSDLAADIRRHLANEPVLAYPPSLAYRTRKFARRHSVGVAVAAAAVVLLLSLSATLMIEAWRLAAERDRANKEAQVSRRITEFLTGLYQASDPSEARGNTVTARELLDKGAQRITTELKDQPEVQARLMDTIGQVYSSLALFDLAKPLLEEAYRLRRKTLGEQHPDVAASLNNLAGLSQDMGDFDRAEGLFREALAMRLMLLGKDHRDVATSLNDLALLLDEKGQFKESEKLHRDALEMRRKLLGDGDPEVAASMNNLALALKGKGDFAGAEPLYRRVLEMRRKLYGEEHPFFVNTLYNLAALLHQKRDYAGAEPLYRQALALDRKLLGNEHTHVADDLNLLASLLRDRGEDTAAEPLLREALAMRRKLLGEGHTYVAQTTASLGSLLLDKGDYREAEPLFRQALTVQRKAPLQGNTAIISPLVGLGRLLLEKGEPRHAQPILTEALDICHRSLSREDLRTALAESVFGGCLAAQKRYVEAEPLLVGSYAIIKDKRGESSREARQAANRLVKLYQAWGKPSKAALYQ